MRVWFDACSASLHVKLYYLSLDGPFHDDGDDNGDDDDGSLYDDDGYVFFFYFGQALKP